MSGPAFEPGDLVSAVIGIAGRAAELVMGVYAGDFEVRHKPDHSPVTEADTGSDALIVRELEALTPDYPVLSEESESPPFETRAGWRRYWLVDPLDGTHGFVARSDEFTINVALVENHRPVLGVVYLPAARVCFHACSGGGAFKMESGGEPRRIRARRRARAPLRVVTSHSRRNPLTAAFIDSLGAVQIERMGSALKSCRVAEGEADVYPGFSRTSEWDTAAAQCLLEEAGGGIIDARSRPLRYNTGPGLENPRFLAVGDTGRDWMADVPDGA